MPRKNDHDNQTSQSSTHEPNGQDAGPAMEMLVGKKEIARELKMSITTLDRYLGKYPFDACGVPGKVMGSWRVDRADVYRWWRWVQGQELRHPYARRFRPEEPSEVAEIAGR